MVEEIGHRKAAIYHLPYGEWYGEKQAVLTIKEYLSLEKTGDKGDPSLRRESSGGEQRRGRGYSSRRSENAKSDADSAPLLFPSLCSSPLIFSCTSPFLPIIRSHLSSSHLISSHLILYPPPQPSATSSTLAGFSVPPRLPKTPE